MMNCMLLDSTKYLEPCGVYTTKEIKDKYQLTDTKLRMMIRYATKIDDRYIIIEDFQADKKNDDTVRLVETNEHICYYVNIKGEVFSVSKGKKRKIKVSEKHPGVVCCYINRKEKMLKHLVAKAFIKDYKDTDVIEHYDNDIFNCSVDNLKLVSIIEHMKERNQRNIAIPVGLYINNELIQEFASYKHAAACLHIKDVTVMRYVKGQVKHKLYDLRKLEGTKNGVEQLSMA